MRAILAAAAVACAGIACGGAPAPTSPTAAPLPPGEESASFRYYYAAGDSVDARWQEQYHAWATARLGVTLPGKISYYKYRTQSDMAQHTGVSGANAFARPDQLEIHTLWPTDNHEVVHVYTAQFGRPPNFFNEGMAVAFQVNPVTGDFVPRFNGIAVHDACRTYLAAGQLVLPLDTIIGGSDWSRIPDATLAYREAGSFMAFVIDRYGLAAVLRFFQASTSTDTAVTAKARFASVTGVAFDTAAADWLAMLQAR